LGQNDQSAGTAGKSAAKPEYCQRRKIWRQSVSGELFTRLSRPRQRFAVCPVQAIVLKKDQFVGPDLIDEMPKWVEDFSRVELNANHWAILSQPEQVAHLIHNFIQQKLTATI
jgi:hypothetical protein